MRILAPFIIGLLLFFFLGHLLSYFPAKGKDFLSRLVPIHHSIFGIFLALIGLVSLILFRASPDMVLFGSFFLGSGLGLTLHHLFFESFIFSEKLEKNFVRRHENRIERLLEMLPGIITWIALTSPIWLSFTLPFALAYLIILADVYWLISALKIGYCIIWGYRKMEWAKKQDWLKKLETDFPGEWDTYYHLIVLPCYNEGMEILGPSIDGVINSKLPKDKIFLGVGREGWAKPELIEETLSYLKKYQGKIGGVLPTIHQLAEGEIKGPATNRNNIVRTAVAEFKKRHIPLDKVLVTTLDSDFVLHPQFLAGALHKYLSTPEPVRDKRTYTGIFLYYNDYWQVPTPMRLIASGTAFWQLAEMVGSDKYMNFSSLSINLKSLLDIGLWIPDKVNDDSGFYWKAYYHFKGDYKVLPHFLPLSADAVSDVNLVKTFQNQYLQLKRWAYGVEHIPFIVTSYFKNKDMDFWDKTDKLIFVFWGYLRWSVLALFVTFAGLLIPILNPNYSQSVVSYNLPVISSWILTLAFLGIFVTVFVHEKTVPKRPSHWGILQRIWSYIQWVMVPLIIVTISTFPAIDAQTSLMFGRYMEFRVTTKVRSSEEKP